MKNNRSFRTAFWLPGFCAAALWLTRCTSTFQYAPFPDQTKRVEDPTKARIYVIRPGKIWGAAYEALYYGLGPASIGPEIDKRSRLDGELGPGGYLCWEIPPRAIEIQHIAGKTNNITYLNLVAGNVYYLRVSIRPSWLTSRAELVQTIISEEEGRSLLKDCQPPEGHQKGNGQ